MIFQICVMQGMSRTSRAWSYWVELCSNMLNCWHGSWRRRSLHPAFVLLAFETFAVHSIFWGILSFDLVIGASKVDFAMFLTSNVLTFSTKNHKEDKLKPHHFPATRITSAVLRTFALNNAAQLFFFRPLCVSQKSLFTFNFKVWGCNCRCRCRSSAKQFSYDSHVNGETMITP